MFSPVVVPAAVSQEVTVFQQSNTSITFSWVKPAVENAEILDWLLKYTLDDITYNVTVAKGQTSYTLLNVQPFIRYSNIMVSI